MSIDEAHKATRKYLVIFSSAELSWLIVNNACPEDPPIKFWSAVEAQAVCDRMNYAAVLQSIIDDKDKLAFSRDFFRTLTLMIENTLMIEEASKK